MDCCCVPVVDTPLILLLFYIKKSCRCFINITVSRRLSSSSNISISRLNGQKWPWLRWKICKFGAIVWLIFPLDQASLLYAVACLCLLWVDGLKFREFDILNDTYRICSFISFCFCAEDFVSESKRFKGIGIGAPEGPISLDDFRSLQRSNKVSLFGLLLWLTMEITSVMELDKKSLLHNLFTSNIPLSRNWGSSWKIRALQLIHCAMRIVLLFSIMKM